MLKEYIFVWKEEKYAQKLAINSNEKIFILNQRILDENDLKYTKGHPYHQIN